MGFGITRATFIGADDICDEQLRGISVILLCFEFAQCKLPVLIANVMFSIEIPCHAISLESSFSGKVKVRFLCF